MTDLKYLYYIQDNFFLTCSVRGKSILKQFGKELGFVICVEAVSRLARS